MKTRPMELTKYILEEHHIDLHHSSPESSFYKTVFTFVLGTSAIIILPFIHIGILYRMIWVPNKTPIDRSTCSCSCFDTIFKGSYENPDHVTYKHVYFNATSESLKIWTVTVTFLLMFYESIRYLVSLFNRGAIRWTMFSLYIINIYPHYYSWWVFFGYYNDSFSKFFNHQLFFTITELLVTAVVLNLCDRNNVPSSWKISAIVTVSLMHTILSGADQNVLQILFGQGKTYQNTRNIAMMVPDLLHVVIPLVVLWRWTNAKRIQLSQMFGKKEIVVCASLILFGTIMGRFL